MHQDREIVESLPVPANLGLTVRRGRARVLITTALMCLLLPVAAGAAPPKPASSVGDLPDPADLPDIEPELEADSESAPEEDPEEDEDESAVTDELADESELAEVEPASEPAPAKKPKSAIKRLSKPKWIKHEVVPGERLDDIATRYDVRTASLIRWNKLDPDKPRIVAGKSLAVYTQQIPPPQQKVVYTVKYGDTWAKIADRYRVDPEHLRERWNPKVPRAFKAGQEIVVWIDPLTDPDYFDDDEPSTKASVGTSISAGSGGRGATAAAAGKATAALPMVTIPKGAVSVGMPNKGKLVNSIALPENKKLYSVRKPDEAYGSSHTLYNLQLGIAQWRQATGFTGTLSIGAISKKGGGRLRPHSSHQSGRDVDIRLPTKRPDGSADSVNDVDWDATWALILSLVSTGEVQYIFLTTDRQKHLLKAAKRAGASKDLIDRMLQYPETSGNKNGIVRNQKGHTAHIHVRFTCAANETKCETY